MWVGKKSFDSKDKQKLFIVYSMNDYIVYIEFLFAHEIHRKPLGQGHGLWPEVKLCPTHNINTVKGMFANIYRYAENHITLVISRSRSPSEVKIHIFF